MELSTKLLRGDKKKVVLSVVIPVYNEAGFILPTLKCVDRAVKNLELGWEVIVVDNNSTDSSNEEIRRFISARAGYKLIFCRQRGVSCALNKGIKSARGKYIARIDVGVRFDKNYLAGLLRTFVRQASRFKLALVGGKMLFKGKGKPQRAIAMALSTPLLAGFARYRRHHTKGFTIADTINSGLFLKRAVAEVGYFDNLFKINQDYELNYRLRQAGWTLLVDYSQTFYYQVTQDFVALWRQYFSYGSYKQAVVAKHPKSWRARQVIGLALLPLAIIFLPFYLLSIFLVSFLLYKKVDSRGVNLGDLTLAFLIIHWAWSLGFYSALLRMFYKKR